MRFVQHKREAYWFYRVLSPLYDRWINPLFWTPAMRSAALDLARLDDRGLRTLDVGAGTGFSSEGIVEHVDVLVGNEEDMQKGLGIRGPEVASDWVSSSAPPNSASARTDWRP